MIVITDLKNTPKITTPCTLSIGNFDGVHLGHKALLERAKEIATTTNSQGLLSLLTFSNHPSELFTPQTPISYLTSTEHRLNLFKSHGVDLVIWLPFNKALADKPFDQFLKMIKDHLPFSNLVLGVGSTFGKDRGGVEEAVKNLGNLLSYKAEYYPKVDLSAQTISSSVIRKLIQEGKLEEASKMLGRAYSVLALFSNPPGTKDLFFADQLTLSKLCLPPEGSYVGRIKMKDKFIPITLHLSKEPLLLSFSCENKEKIRSHSMFELIFDKKI